MQLTELSTEYFLGVAAASVASMVATPLLMQYGICSFLNHSLISINIKCMMICLNI